MNVFDMFLVAALVALGVAVNRLFKRIAKIESELTVLTADRWRRLTEEIRAAMTQNIPLRRFASLEDITNSARFLLSDEGGYITGETLVLDGGESLYKGMFSGSPATPKS